nr:hypothetical protein TetV2_00401 [Oceanusvirus sp.]
MKQFDRLVVLAIGVMLAGGCAWAAWGTFDSVILAAAGAVIFLCLLHRTVLAPASAPTNAEPFQQQNQQHCGDGSDAQEEDTTELDGMSKILYSSVFGPEPVSDGVWGRLRFNQERSPVSQIPEGSILARSGIPTLNRSIHGPYANNLGISSSDAYTVAAVLRFSGFDTFEGVDVDTETLLHIPSSTQSDNALLNILKVDFTYDSAIEGTTSHNVRFNVISGASSGNKTYQIDTEKTYMLVFSRDGPSVVSRIYQLEVSTSTGSLVDSDEIVSIGDAQENLALSNQPMVLNSTGILNARMFAFAVFDRSLSEPQEVVLQEYFGERIREAVDPGAMPGGCPYGPAVCTNQYCAGVADWSRPELIIDSRSECKDAIDQWCKENPEHSSCYCWNPDDTRSTGDDCRRWLTFLRRGECKDLNNLDEEDLENIKKKYEIKCCEKDATPPKPKTGIINHYEEGESAEGNDDASDQDESEDDGIRNYYKPPSAAAATAASSKPATGISGTSVVNPYVSGGTPASSASPATSSSSTVPAPVSTLRPSSTATPSGNRVGTVQRLTSYKDTDEPEPSTSSPAESSEDGNDDMTPPKSGSIISWVRNILSG